MNNLRRYRPQRGHWYRFRSSETGHVISVWHAARLERKLWVAEQILRIVPRTEAELRRAQKRFDEQLKG